MGSLPILSFGRQLPPQEMNSWGSHPQVLGPQPQNTKPLLEDFRRTDDEQAIPWPLVVTVTLALGGCKQIEEAKKAAEALKAAASAVQGAKGPAISSEEDKDAELGAKLGEYISCMNNTSKRVVDSRNRYPRGVKDGKGRAHR